MNAGALEARMISISVLFSLLSQETLAKLGTSEAKAAFLPILNKCQ